MTNQEPKKYNFHKCPVCGKHIDDNDINCDVIVKKINKSKDSYYSYFIKCPRCSFKSTSEDTKITNTIIDFDEYIQRIKYSLECNWNHDSLMYLFYYKHKNNIFMRMNNCVVRFFKNIIWEIQDWIFRREFGSELKELDNYKKKGIF